MSVSFFNRDAMLSAVKYYCRRVFFLYTVVRSMASFLGTSATDAIGETICGDRFVLYHFETQRSW